MTIDLNCDMGELPEAVHDGSQEAIMRYITSVNVASGGHAGDEATMRATIEQARRWNLGVGAHPSYPDRVNFGRIAIEMTPDAIAQTVWEQVRALAEIAGRQGVELRHVKPHGALYNTAVTDEPVAGAIAAGVSRWSKDVVLVGLAGSRMLEVFREAGFRVAAEGFADRRYEPDGALRSRRFADALITDPALAAQQALNIAERSATICIHGDTPGACDIAAAVFRALKARGVELRSL
jgi:UPF0271 protein